MLLDTLFGVTQLRGDLLPIFALLDVIDYCLVIRSRVRFGRLVYILDYIEELSQRTSLWNACLL